MKEIVIIGAGGLARDIFAPLCLQLKENETIKGVLADDEAKFSSSHINARYLGAIDSYTPQENDYFLLCFGRERTRIYHQLKAKGARFYTFIHSSVILPEHYFIGEGSIIGAYCIVGENSYIGANVFANKFVNIGHDSHIGDHSILCPYVMVSGGAKVGESSFLSTRVSLAPNTHIGKNCVISAHSFVKKHITDSMFVSIHSKLIERRR